MKGVPETPVWYTSPLLFRQELVYDYGAVVAHDLAGDAAVVVLVTNGRAAALIELLIAEQTLFVPITEPVSARDLPARGLFVGKRGCPD